MFSVPIIGLYLLDNDGRTCVPGLLPLRPLIIPASADIGNHFAMIDCVTVSIWLDHTVQCSERSICDAVGVGVYIRWRIERRGVPYRMVSVDPKHRIHNTLSSARSYGQPPRDYSINHAPMLSICVWCCCRHYRFLVCHLTNGSHMKLYLIWSFLCNPVSPCLHPWHDMFSRRNVT